MAVVQGSTLYAGSVSKALIYEIKKGSGFQWKDLVYTEPMVDRKPRQLTRAEHAGNPIVANIPNPVAADFTGTPTVTIDGRQLSVTELMVKDSLADLQFKETFPEYQPTGSNIDLKTNPAIAKVVMDLIMDATQAQMNNLHSIGDSALVANPLEYYDGFKTLIIVDVDATQVGTPAVLTSGNIIAKVRELVHSVPGRLRNNPSLKIICSIADYDLWNEARSNTQNYQPSPDIAGTDTLLQSFGSNLKFVPIDGMSKDFMFITIADATPKSNLVQGVWVESDADTLKVYKITEADQEWKIIMRFDLGVQYRSGKDIFYINNV